MLDTFTRQNVIGRLRVAGTNVDALSARLRAERLLNAADLEAAQPTPSAIVIIRKLRDPLPGAETDRSATEPPMEWKAALTSALRSVAGRAGRPAVEAVSGNEEAIIFAVLRGITCVPGSRCVQGFNCDALVVDMSLRAGHDYPDAIKKIWAKVRNTFLLLCNICRSVTRQRRSYNDSTTILFMSLFGRSPTCSDCNG